MRENNMILTDEMKKRIKEEFKQVQKERAEREANPLSQYSTTELKKRTQEETK